MRMKGVTTDKRSSVISSGATQNDESSTAVALLILRDITELYEQGKTKEQYLSLISHDLRNPLAVIEGNAHILRRILSQAGIDNRAEQTIRFITDSVERMSNMLRDLADLSLLESEQVQLGTEPVCVRSLVLDLLQRQSAVSGWQRVKAKFPKSLRPTEADPARLERILVNLIENAIKYSTPDGEVLVRGKMKGNMLLLSVSDQGPGIARGDLPYVFDRFYRGKDVPGGKGLGLGLYITKMLVEAQGGQAYVESEPGKGSCFYFTLPLATPDESCANQGGTGK